MENKLDLILKDLQKLNEKLDSKFEQIDKRFEQIEDRLNKIEDRINKIENRLGTLENRVNNLEARINAMEIRLDNRITIVDSNRKEDSEKIFEAINSLNNSFLKFEAEMTDKIKILFDEDTDRKNHQIIYAQEFTTLNNLVAKNSFRISNLEKHNKH